MILKVIRSANLPNSDADMWCEDERGYRFIVDLSDGLPESQVMNELIGKTVSVEKMIPYIQMAYNVKILEEAR